MMGNTKNRQCRKGGKELKEMKKNIFKKLAALVAAVTTVVAMGTTVFAADTYNVAGAEGLCGAGWDPSQNQMTDNGNGTWSKEFKDVKAGTYEFKVVLNGTWGTEYNLEGDASSGGGNASVKVDVDGSTVVVGFDGTKATVKVEAPKAENDTTTNTENTTTNTENNETTKPADKPDSPDTGDSSAVVLMLAVAAVAAGAVVVSRKRAVNE